MPSPKADLNKTDLIAPCGINCRLCRAYTRERNPCPGCRLSERFRSDNAMHCSVHCEQLAGGTIRYCFECRDFPCARLLHLDKRYRTTYYTSPLDNLQQIRTGGIHAFIRSENDKWACPRCGEMLCMHQPDCPSCGHAWHAPGDKKSEQL